MGKRAIGGERKGRRGRESVSGTGEKGSRQESERS